MNEITKKVLEEIEVEKEQHLLATCTSINLDGFGKYNAAPNAASKALKRNDLFVSLIKEAVKELYELQTEDKLPVGGYYGNDTQKQIKFSYEHIYEYGGSYRKFILLDPKGIIIFSNDVDDDIGVYPIREYLSDEF